MRKALVERDKGKLVVLVVLTYQSRALSMLSQAAAEIRHIGTPAWLPVEDGTPNPKVADRQPCLLAILRPTPKTETPTKPVLHPLVKALRLAVHPGTPDHERLAALRQIHKLDTHATFIDCIDPDLPAKYNTTNEWRERVRKLRAELDQRERRDHEAAARERTTEG